ncbi:TPA: alpha/beta hydrolase [Pseudomonas aeruginosa]|nr:alpha/beta hydrolase [Pseudomonas aeruginosa]
MRNRTMPDTQSTSHTSGEHKVFKDTKLLRIGLGLMIACTASCANYTKHLYDEAQRANRRPMIFDTESYRIQAVLPQAQVRHLRIYIEGDGKAWATRSQPSTDPTPTKQLVANLAASDPTPSAYLARPCQYVQDRHCNPQVWTDLRFSKAAVNSLSAAVDQAMRAVGANEVDLVGYSGGGTLALLVAAKRSDVTSVQTLAGNVAPLAWAKMQGLTGLQDALDPAGFANALRDIPQRHLVGTRDKVIPATLARQFASSLGPSACAQLVAVDATHEEGWQAAWSKYRALPIGCHYSSDLSQ